MKHVSWDKEMQVHWQQLLLQLVEVEQEASQRAFNPKLRLIHPFSLP